MDISSLIPDSKYGVIVHRLSDKKDVLNQYEIIKNLLKWKLIVDGNGQFSGGYYSEYYQHNNETAIFGLSENDDYYEYTLRKTERVDE